MEKEWAWGNVKREREDLDKGNEIEDASV